MVGYKGSIRIALIGVSGILALFPLLSGQGCGLIPRVDDGSASKDVGNTGNVSPYLEFTAPLTDLSREIGDVIHITWTCTDPDNNATIELLVDPDDTFGNGNERTVGPLILQNSGKTWFDLDTGALALANGTYRIVARVNDGVNPEVLAVAPGKLLLYKAGLLPGNKAPKILVSAPLNNLGVSQNDQVTITFCGSDADKGLDGITPDIIVLLDQDNDPYNDLNLRDANAEATLATLLQGGLPHAINGAIVVGLYKSTDCGLVQLDALGNPVIDPVTLLPITTPPTSMSLVVDVGQIPPLASGSPYRIRADIWDHLNRPLSSYAPGSITVTALGSGVIDLAQVGRSVSGTKFMGFDSGGMAGSAATDMGDFDDDGADDFVVVSRFGNPFGLGNIGSSHLICGMKGQKFGNEVQLNSIGNTVRGTPLPLHSGAPGVCISEREAPGLQGTQGIVSVARVGDVNGDRHPEILYGLPYVMNFYDHVNDDPCTCGCPSTETAPGCYSDLLPNPWSGGSPCTLDGCGRSHMGDRDWRELETGGSLCSNDKDLARKPYLDGGYAILVGSVPPNSVKPPFIGDPSLGINSTIRGLDKAGQNTDGGDPVFPGARFRGAWYDNFDGSQTRRANSLIPDNSFGQTVRSMPYMRDTDLSISSRFGSTLLLSAPNAFGGYGGITYVPGQDFTTFTGGETNSFPTFGCLGACPSVSRVIGYPGYLTIGGGAVGDQFGYADAAGDFNLDGSRDIVCGAPGATRNGIAGGGIVYVIFGRPDFGNIDFSGRSGPSNPPRMEIRGTTPNDHFGGMQTIVGDINQDGLPDIGFASKDADGPGGVDAGFVGILFGGQRMTGENTFSVSQVGTAQLPGCKLYGSQPGGNAGAMIANANDFNGDGIDDIIISAPNETRVINGQLRKGVAYIVFGGPHLYNAALSLGQVGTPQLPGVVFVSPYAVGSADEAPIDMVSPAGDVNGDGFADVVIGVSKASYVNPLDPSQRRLLAGEAYLIYGSNTGTNGMK
jgi:hypothetical protein